MSVVAKKSYVVVTGSVAAGATTLAEKLRDEWAAETLLEQQIEETNPFFSRVQADPTRWGLASQVHFITQSVVRHRRLASMLNDDSVASVVLEDRTPFEHTGAYVEAMSAERLLPEDEVSLLRELTREIEHLYLIPDLLVYREMTENQLSTRVQQRARLGEDVDLDKLRAIHQAFDAFIASWTRSPVVRIPAHMDVLNPTGFQDTLDLIAGTWRVPAV